MGSLPLRQRRKSASPPQPKAQPIPTTAPVADERAQMESVARSIFQTTPLIGFLGEDDCKTHFRVRRDRSARLEADRIRKLHSDD
jgi:hypothetical protein